MAEEKNFIITESNYTFKRKHKNLPDGTIYERDYMATTNLGGFDSGVFPNEERNFKIVPVSTTSVKRKHFYGDSGTTYTLEDIDKNRTRESTESFLTANDKHTSLLDFVYYGNCVDFLQSCVENIIFNFPAEFYFASKEAISGWYYIENPFNINIWDNKVLPSADSRVNEMRYFALNVSKYMVYGSDNSTHGCLSRGNWDTKANNDFAFCDGQYSHEITLTIDNNEVVIRRYYLNGEFVLLYQDANMCGWYIRPSEGYVNAVFDALGDFEKTLLNRDTNPLYTAILDYPHETETGIETYKKAFTWPQDAYVSHTVSNNAIISKAHVYNIDISSGKYQLYINSLLKLCEFYDENFTDNLWRNLTHDAIKNLDNTFIRENSTETEEDTKENVEKVHKFLMACSRQFDEIKRYADGIKNVNSITYNDEANLPDYFLTDSLNLSGWEITNSLKNVRIFKPGEQSNVYIPILVKGLFKGIANKEYDSVDTNVQFLKNLKLNSQEILSRKGTRYGIEMLLGLFGMVSDDFAGYGEGDYHIDEFVTIATPKNGDSPTTGETNVEKFGAMRLSQSEITGEGNDPNPTEGLPVKIIEFNGSRRMVPWFKMKNEYGRIYELDGGVYFQMYGGWDKNENGYGETVNYLGIVERKRDLQFVPVSEIHDGNFFFSIEDGVYYRYDENSEGEKWKEYLKVEDVSGSSVYYLYIDGAWASRADLGPDYEYLLDEAIETVSKIENIIDDETGNNPHVGYGHYDDGKTFYEYLKQIFKYSIENCAFTDEAYNCNCNDADCEDCLIDEISDCGFDVSDVNDNVKCWFHNPDTLFPSTTSYDEVTVSGFSGHYSCSIDGFKPYDFTTDSTGLTENSSYSVINNKTMVITFKIPGFDGDSLREEYKQFIKDAVMPYVRQIIPSTTIFSVEFR